MITIEIVLDCVKLNMRPDWFFLVFITFWQMIHWSLRTKISKKALL